MLKEVYICTLFLLCRFIYRFMCSLPGSTFISRLICSLQTVAMPHTPSAPRNRSTKTHGFIRITITITIIQEQIHKLQILHKPYSRPSEPAQIPPHLLPTAPAPSRKLSLSIFGSTTSTGVALFGAQHSRRSGTAQIPRYLLPSAPAPSMKLSLSVFGSTNEA